MREKCYRVRNLQNGGIYVIGKKKLKNQPTKWDIILPEDELEGRAEDIPPEELRRDEGKELSYIELKETLDEMGVLYKGNSKKAELLELYIQNAVI